MNWVVNPMWIQFCSALITMYVQKFKLKKLINNKNYFTFILVYDLILLCKKETLIWKPLLSVILLSVETFK